jgi:prepilin-type N-terminal cleavage/methylation domain-containing protein
MKSPTTSTRSHGFTLIETIVVMSMLAMVGAFTMVVSMDSYKGYGFRNERDTLVMSLLRARSQAISNMCLGASGTCTDGKPHGVHLASDAFIIFQGTTYALRDIAVDESIPRQAMNVTVGGTLTDVIFSQLSGQVATPGDISMSDPTHASTVSINGEGRVSWSN